MIEKINNKYQFLTLFASPRIVKEFGVSAAIVFGDILYCSERFGYYDASYKQIKEKLGFDQNAFIRIKNRLINAGWISSIVKESNRGHITKLTDKAIDEVLSFREIKLGIKPELAFNQFYTVIVPFMLQKMSHPSQVKKAYNMAYMLTHLAYKCDYSQKSDHQISGFSTYQLAKQLGFSDHTAKSTLAALVDEGFIALYKEDKKLVITPTSKMISLNIIKIRSAKQATEIPALDKLVDNVSITETELVDITETEQVRVVKLRESFTETEVAPNVYKEKPKDLLSSENQLKPEKIKLTNTDQIALLHKKLLRDNKSELANKIEQLLTIDNEFKNHCFIKATG